MSAIPSKPLNQSSSSTPTDRPRLWIFNAWLDHLLIISTPLLVIPAYFVFNSSKRVTSETIALVVTSFFALGHHLPGLIRAYGDSELFQRFKWRFVLAPPLLFIAYFPLDHYHYDTYRFVIVAWATWHGMMQLYGFVRIYDLKVGSTSPVTAYWDWLMCLCWYVTGAAFSPFRMSEFLGNWYSIGGPLIPPGAVHAGRWILLCTSIAVLLGFARNYIRQSRYGPKPNPIKLMLLASGIGTWWFVVVYLENAILGVSLGEICHGSQYLAIVWLYNCRRVRSDPRIGHFMKSIFRNGAAFLYLGMIAAYGAIGLIPSIVEEGTAINVLNAFLGTSTILHYYYDGFIWKVREKDTRVNLGLSQQTQATRQKESRGERRSHVLKWSPLIALLGWTFATELFSPSLTQTRKDEIDKRYAQTLIGGPSLPTDLQERAWVYSQFDRAKNIAASVPGDKTAQLRVATMLANLGQNDEAVTSIEKILAQHPNFTNGFATLGGIHFYRGNLDQASICFQAVLANAATKTERANASLKLGIIDLYQNDRMSSEKRFDAALRDNPRLEAEIENLRKNVKPSKGF